MHDYCSRCFVPPIQQFKLTAQRKGGIKGSKRFPIDWILLLFLLHISESLSYFWTVQITMTNYCRNPIVSHYIWTMVTRWHWHVTCIGHYDGDQGPGNVTCHVWQRHICVTGRRTPHGHSPIVWADYVTLSVGGNDHHCSKPCKYQTLVASPHVDMALWSQKP